MFFPLPPLNCMNVREQKIQNSKKQLQNKKTNAMNSEIAGEPNPFTPWPYQIAGLPALWSGLKNGTLGGGVVWPLMTSGIL